MKNDPALITEELYIDGLHCIDCSQSIEHAVSRIAGVHTVEANFAAGKATVTYENRTDIRQHIVDAIKKVGYQVRPEKDKEYKIYSIWQQRRTFFATLSGSTLFSGIAIKYLSSDPLLFTVSGRSFPLSFFFLLLATLFGAYYFGREGWRAITSLRFNLSFLMSIAIIGAFIIEEYIEAASLAFLFSLAELLESYAVGRARNSLRQLMTLTPAAATVRRNGQVKEVPVREIQIGDRLLIRPGEKIAADGVIVEGVSSVDQSLITGEPVPVKRESGEKVFAGSFNVEGYLEVEVNSKAEKSLLARIIHLIEKAEAQKAPSQRFVEKFARIYTPAVVSLAVAVAVIPPLFGMSFTVWFLKALTLLVIACPCALVISTPVSVVSALTSASRNGILIKGGVYLETLSKIKVVAFDKTGTLTKAQLKVTDVIPLNGMTRDELLRIAASLEIKSEHPISKAITAAADGFQLAEVKAFKSIPGFGVTGSIGDQLVLVGNMGLFKNKNMTLQPYMTAMEKLQKNGKTTMLVGDQNQILGIIGLQDQIREDAVAMIARLKKLQKHVVMITGDNQNSAKTIAGQLNITEVHAQLLPEDKMNCIRALHEEYGLVAMIGDGINDAPALAASSVGIAMGVAGTDTALETADVALMTDRLAGLPYLFELSNRTSAIINQNVWASILLKFSLAFGVFPGLVSLVLAVLVGDMGASLGVILNSMRLAGQKAS
jgi:Cd2+/Zn2+-exporting ATPase